MKRVLVSGAAGRTGKLVVQKLRERPEEFEVVCLVRRPDQAAELGSTTVVGDITRPETYEAALAGCTHLVILSSAVPKMLPTANPDDPPVWGFEPGQEPEQIDWLGQRAQVDLALRHGLRQVVLVSSMGVTQADHPLNRMGRILLWKRFAEMYLIAHSSSRTAYTVVHPGGLIDQPGGLRQLLVGKHDALMATGGPRTVPRADVAEVVVQAMRCEEALNKSFDLVARGEGEGEPTSHWEALFGETTAGF